MNQSIPSCLKALPIFLIAFLTLLLPVASFSLDTNTILVVGDSLSAAYGINIEKGWVALLEKRLQQENLPYHVINISTSGDTTRNGLAKLPPALKQYKPTIVLIGLGSNDGLRGLSPDVMQVNLIKMVELSQKENARVLLLGSLIPMNYGPEYRKKFEQAFDNTAKQYKLPKVPFLLDGVWDSPELIQDDNLHPNEAAQPIILENVWPYLKKML